MKAPVKLLPHLNRFCTFYSKDDPAVPKELMSCNPSVPDMKGILYPLPSRKNDYTCFAKGNNDVVWFGAKTGLTRYDQNAKRKEDLIMYFSADRDLLDNEVEALIADGDSVWVLTKTGVAHIEMKMLTPREKADVLLKETVNYVDRRGMISQKYLATPRVVESALPFGHSDNDGCFTAGFAIAEILHYAVLKREKGEDHPETQEVKAIALRASEACLLLMYISGRGDGFVARTYLAPDEPIPDDGLFFRKENGKATCIDTKMARKRELNNKTTDASARVPDRLAKLYRDAGYGDDGIVYKGDTSSDEITLHYLHLYFAHKFLGCDDKELDKLIIDAAVATMNHIIENGYELHECDGAPTTWAKWSPEYFETGLGWADACLNAAEILMHLRVVMEITGEKGKWQRTYDELINMGYADLTTEHFNRFYQVNALAGFDCVEDLMYGDHMLATTAFWGLIMLEDNEELKEKFKQGYKSWRSTLAREHNPGYDFPFALSCPDEEIDMEKIATWFYRFNPSRLAAGVSLVGRHDMPVRIRKGKTLETSYLLTPDECFISKFDRNPYAYKNEDSGGINCVESCYVYTFSYWIGIYYGFITE